MAAKSKDGKGLYMSCRCGCGDTSEICLSKKEFEIFKQYIDQF